jgi:hypothetical protein
MQARIALTRKRVRSRVARTRVAIMAGVAAATCGLALFIQSVTPGSSTAAARTSASGVSGSVQPLVGGGGSGASAPGASSGQGDAVSGGS